MGEPAAADGPSMERALSLTSVPSPSTGAGQPVELADLAVRLATALRAVRGYVPHRIWWEAGPAEVLLAYQATEAP